MTSVFRRELAARNPDPAGRRWIFVPYDQLTDRVGPLAGADPAEVGVVIVENAWKAGRRPYHRQKLALVLAGMRHFALELAERGVAVRHVTGRAPYSRLLAPLIEELGPLTCMLPAERELRADLRPLVTGGQLEMVPNAGWLTATSQFEEACLGRKEWRLERFYRLVRRQTGILMEPDGTPVGGQFNFDIENRQAWNGTPPAPEAPRFPVDPIKEEVADLVERHFARHPGQIDLESLPATAVDAESLWAWALRECLPAFGPYEDAMSRESRGLFHTRVSPLVNILRLLPGDLVRDALDLDIPMASKEGFVRQVLGWREFMRHVHEATNGFRDMPDGIELARARDPGDGGWSRWQGKTWRRSSRLERLDGGVAPAALGGSGSTRTRPLPPAYWGQPSGLECLDTVVADVWAEAWSHHIARLMVLGNLATLLDVSPRELTDWFWVAYQDAYDWVVEPNVLGMGSFALGKLFTSKPYIAGAAYIDRMSDYCTTCRFSPRTSCPITPLYWAFLDRHSDELAGNHRMAMPLRSLSKRGAARRTTDAKVFTWVAETLAGGEPLDPGDAPGR